MWAIRVLKVPFICLYATRCIRRERVRQHFSRDWYLPRLRGLSFWAREDRLLFQEFPDRHAQPIGDARERRIVRVRDRAGLYAAYSVQGNARPAGKFLLGQLPRFSRVSYPFADVHDHLRYLAGYGRVYTTHTLVDAPPGVIIAQVSGVGPETLEKLTNLDRDRGGDAPAKTSYRRNTAAASSFCYRHRVPSPTEESE